MKDKYTKEEKSFTIAEKMQAGISIAEDKLKEVNTLDPIPTLFKVSP